MTTTSDIRIYKCVNAHTYTYYILDFSCPYSRSIVINYTPLQEHKKHNIECFVGEMVIRIVKSMDQLEARHALYPYHALYSYCESTFLELLVVAGITKGQLEQIHKTYSTESMGSRVTLW